MIIRNALGIGVLLIGAPAAAAGVEAKSLALPGGLDTYLSQTVDDSSIKPNTNEMYFGSGNTPHNYIVQRNEAYDIELALKTHYRQGADIAPTFIDSNGVIHVEVPSGPQVVDPAHNVPVANPNRAAWNFAFSVNVGLDGSSRTLDNYIGVLLLDTDPSDKVKYLRLHLTMAPGSSAADANGYGWQAGGNVVIGDDEGTMQVTQNSFNYAFIANLIDSDPQTPGVQPYAFGTGEFDVELILRGGLLGLIEFAHLHVVMNVTDPAP